MAFPKTNGQVLNASEVNRLWAKYGDGSDGAFSTSSGTTDITLGQVYQYTSFSLGVSATLSPTTASDKPAIILVEGDCTINGKIDLKGKCSGVGFSGGNNAYFGIALPAANGNSGGAPQGGSGAVKSFANFYSDIMTYIWNGTKGGTGGGGDASNGGGGGGGGCSSRNNGNGGNGASGAGAGGGAAGGNGGATLFLVVGGDITFGTSSEIDTSGNNGSNGGNGGGGGGGGAGDIVVIYGGAVTDNGLTKTISGGSGGTTSGVGGAGGNGGNGTYIERDVDDVVW